MARNSNGLPPTYIQAGIYTEVAFYLKAIQAAGTDNADKVVAQMRTMKINDFMTKNGWLREDGRVMRDMYLEEVKSPAESKYPFDYVKILATIPADKPSDRSRREDARSYMQVSKVVPMRPSLQSIHGPQHLVSTQLFQRVSGIVQGSAERDQAGILRVSFGRRGRSAAEPQDTCHFRRLLPHASAVPGRRHSPARANRRSELGRSTQCDYIPLFQNLRKDCFSPRARNSDPLP